MIIILKERISFNDFFPFVKGRIASDSSTVNFTLLEIKQLQNSITLIPHSWTEQQEISQLTNRLYLIEPYFSKPVRLS